MPPVAVVEAVLLTHLVMAPSARGRRCRRRRPSPGPPSSPAPGPGRSAPPGPFFPHAFLCPFVRFRRCAPEKKDFSGGEPSLDLVYILYSPFSLSTSDGAPARFPGKRCGNDAKSRPRRKRGRLLGSRHRDGLLPGSGLSMSRLFAARPTKAALLRGARTELNQSK